MIALRIANLLRAGMWAAVAVLLAGAAWYLGAHGGEQVDVGTGHVRHGLALMQIGIGILVATPIARVAFAAGAFLHAGDRVYAAIAATVFCILLYSLFGGH
jgi:hypothetical protein